MAFLFLTEAMGLSSLVLSRHQTDFSRSPGNLAVASSLHSQQDPQLSALGGKLCRNTRSAGNLKLPALKKGLFNEP